MIKLAICVPSGQMVEHEFMAAAMKLCVETTGRMKEAKISDLFVVACESTYSPITRELITEEALGQGATHLFWLDADMEFPPDAALWLLQRGDYPVIGANYPQRRGGHLPTTFKTMGLPKTYLYSTDQVGIESVASIGFGCCLMKAEVFEKVPRPWFKKELMESEDCVFNERVLHAGFTVWVDHDLSQRVAHIYKGKVGFGRPA